MAKAAASPRLRLGLLGGGTGLAGGDAGTGTKSGTGLVEGCVTCADSGTAAVGGLPVETSAMASATARMDGRPVGSGESMSMISGVSAPQRCGAGNCPEATRCSNAMVLSSVPNGGLPSIELYSVDPSENTSDAKFASLPRATSGAR